MSRGVFECLRGIFRSSGVTQYKDLALAESANKFSSDNSFQLDTGSILAQYWDNDF